MVRTSGLAAIHPGEFLAEILAELGVSPSWFGLAIAVSPMRVSHVIGGSRPVTAELALMFGKALGQSPEYWLNLQSAYDLAKARSAVGARLKGMRPLPEVALARKDACLTHLARSRSKKPGITAGLFPKTDLATGHQSLTRPAANTSRTSGWSASEAHDEFVACPVYPPSLSIAANRRDVPQADISYRLFARKILLCGDEIGPWRIIVSRKCDEFLIVDFSLHPIPSLFGSFCGPGK